MSKISPVVDDEEDAPDAPEPEPVAQKAPAVPSPVAGASEPDEPERRPLPAHISAMNPANGDDFIAREGFDPTQLTNKLGRKVYAPVIKEIETGRKRAAAEAAFNAGEDARLAGVKKKQEADTAKRDKNAAEEEYYRTAGIETYIDAHGDQVPKLDDDGKPVYRAKKFPVEYDAEGRASQTTRDTTGKPTTVDPDAGAKIGPHKDAPGRLFKQNKATGWQDLGSIEENLNHGDPRLATAAAAAKAERDKKLATEAGRGFTQAGNAIDLEEMNARAAYESGPMKELAIKDAAIAAASQSQALKEKTWIGGQTDNAKEAAAALKKLQDERNLYDETNKPPDLDGYKARRAALPLERGSFAALIETHGGDVNAAAAEYRAKLKDPDNDPAMQHLEKSKKALGMRTFAE